jgi:hypothetical protein
MRRYILPLIIATLLLNVHGAIACTSAIVSGTATPDGRPLMWKHRDTSSDNNKLLYFTGGVYAYTGMVSTGKTENSSVWMGMNSAGFAIMNTVSYNINPEGNEEGSYGEGSIMARALAECATLEDFENLLDELTKPTGLAANFGVIDAQGGAAYYETGDYRWIKIDVNDRSVAPLGYMVKTNYSSNGNMETGQGYARYITASDIFYRAAMENSLTPEMILQRAERSLVNGFTGDDLISMATEDDKVRMVHFKDNIARKTTTSSAIFKGVKPGEDPMATLMWTVCGWPLATVAYPVWMNSANMLPGLLTAPQGENSALCDAGLAAKKAAMPITRGHGQDYININMISNRNNTGYLQWIMPLEEKIIDITEEKVRGWKSTAPSVRELQELYSTIDNLIFNSYSLNGINLK